MQEITVTINADRTGSVSGYLGGLTKELYRLNGSIADGVKAVLLTPDGRTLAVSNEVVGGAVEMDTDTQEVADLLRYQPVGAEAAVHIAIGDPDNLIAIVPATLRKNWLDDSAVHPPTPLPEYWTAEQIQEALRGKQDALVAGDNITLEPQDDGTVKVSATAEPITVDKTVPATAAGADPTHAASTPMAMQRIVGYVRPSLSSAGKLGYPNQSSYGFYYYNTANGLIWYRNANTSEVMLYGAEVKKYLGGDMICIDGDWINFCGTLLGGAKNAVEMGCATNAWSHDECSDYGGHLNTAIGAYSRIGLEHTGWTASPASVFGFGTYANMRNSTTIGASTGDLNCSILFSLVSYGQYGDPPWVGFATRDEFSNTNSGARMSANQFIAMLKSHGASDWEGPWGQYGCCGDYCGEEYCGEY